MKVIGINGSARKDRNTALIINIIFVMFFPESSIRTRVTFKKRNLSAWWTVHSLSAGNLK